MSKDELVVHWTSHACGNTEHTALSRPCKIALQAAVRRWLARCSEAKACQAQRDGWDRCLMSDGSTDQDHSQPGSSASAAMLIPDEAAECLAAEHLPGCMASSDSCSIPISSLTPTRPLEMTNSEHDCRPLVNDKAPVMAMDADAQGAHVDDEELAGLDLQRLQLLLELHDDWRKQSTCEKQCESDAAVSAQHASDDAASHETLQDSCSISETVRLQTVTSGSSCNLEQVCKANYASLTPACGS